jgi:hypothetical protein
MLLSLVYLTGGVGGGGGDDGAAVRTPDGARGSDDGAAAGTSELDPLVERALSVGGLYSV